VLDYLKAENAIRKPAADQAALRETLFEEIKGRILETDLSLPSRGAPTCITRAPPPATNTPATTAARARPTTANTVDESREQLLLDPNPLANGGFFSLGAFSISPDHQRWPTASTPAGDEIYTLYVKELATDASANWPSTTATAA
jgi:oligopeptidase B